MGRHSLVRPRRSRARVMTALGLPAAALLVAGADVQRPAEEPARPVVAEAPPCCVELVAAPPAGFATVSGASGTRVQWVASRAAARQPQVLPAGLAPEQGLQVKTILVARAVSAIFPEIQSIGGVRADPLPWHPNGLAIDVMIPNASSAEGIALGNQIVAFALKNAERFGLQDCIWRGVYYTPGGGRAGGYGHYDHVHITTHGGGYPTGGEVYYR
ncbi:hypothetical protein FK535_06270 [Mycolicibacterium sp. 018/SC-01/001]|uniref:hypothetical protein n=1 Tax=Mycolicibacterium sp. 018/SC-01/001 TaxID=2592069 RepID=UPI00117EB5BB|nr:hypothetical protein [Mycolicibacterium sp. 018/SC-01/001]TRW88026.1 hypothetical protein FK535_06270 [Mycolicibacterium sp. 018/SC-01/001]